MTIKIMTADQAVASITDGAGVLFGGFVACVVPEELEAALGRRFEETNSPQDLTVIYAAGQGDGNDRALNQIAHEGLVKKIIGGHWGLVPKLQKLAIENKIEAYNLPQGIISHLCRDISAGKPGTISKVGLRTFVDPRLEGGKINDVTTEDIVDLIELDGEDYLFYKKFPVDFALLRGTTADEDGNITMEDEALTICNQVAAAACHNSGGKVIVQVKQIVKRGELNPQLVKIPGIYVDIVVVNSDQKLHMQTYDDYFDQRKVTQAKVKNKQLESNTVDLDAKWIIARRAALELKKNTIVNFGIGVPEYVAEVARNENFESFYTATVEAGAIGGTPAGGLSFGTAIHPQAIVSQDYQFDFYDGGGLDQAFLGLAQADQFGNINVSKFGTRIAGCGGFINISQSVKEVIFCGTFTAQGLLVEVEKGKLKIIKEGQQKKFIDQVEQITYSGIYAWEKSQRVLYITERAVFTLGEDGLVLSEIAPGIDLEKDVISQMSFQPEISASLKKMDSRIFKLSKIGLVE